MSKRLRSRKGFTLIELLAVIVILAILMTLAVVSMQRYITKAKKDTYVTTALQFLNSIRFGIVNGEYSTPSGGSCTVVRTSVIELESGGMSSPFGKKFEENKSFVIVYNKGTGEKDEIEYFITMRDVGGNGFAITAENSLNYKDIKQKDFAGVTVPALNGTVALPGIGNCSVQYTHDT